MKNRINAYKFTLCIFILIISCNTENTSDYGDSTDLMSFKDSNRVCENLKEDFIERNMTYNEWLYRRNDLYYPVTIVNENNKQPLQGDYYLLKRYDWILICRKNNHLLNSFPLLSLSSSDLYNIEDIMMCELFPSPRLMNIRLEINREIDSINTNRYNILIKYTRIIDEPFQENKIQTSKIDSVLLIFNRENGEVFFKSRTREKIW